LKEANSNENSLFQRVYKNLENRRQRLITGKVNCIPWGFPRFEEESPGIEKGKYFLMSANQKVGKTQITDWLFVYSPILQILDNDLNIKLKIFYFSLEIK
jgi:hypothetical protein